MSTQKQAGVSCMESQTVKRVQFDMLQCDDDHQKEVLLLYSEHTSPFSYLKEEILIFKLEVSVLLIVCWVLFYLFVF